ncbi:hypothetical protein D3C75_851610 [compost metagenome]
MPGKLFEGLVLDRTEEKTPARKTSGGRLGKAPVQQGVGWSGYRKNFISPGRCQGSDGRGCHGRIDRLQATGINGSAAASAAARSAAGG